MPPTSCIGPPAVDPKLRAELNDKYRKDTDGARDKMNQVARAPCPARSTMRQPSAAGIDALNVKFTALREAIDKAIDGPADARKDAAKKIVADNAVFNTAVTTLLDEQVRKIAQLDGDAYRQASYANIAWTLRDVGGSTPACTRTSSAPSAPRPRPRRWISAARRAAATRS